MSKNIKRFVSIFAVIGIIFIGIFGINEPLFKHSINAEETIQYLDGNGDTQSINDSILIPTEESTSIYLGNGNNNDPLWYHVKEESIYNNKIIINGAVNIILGNGSILKANDGIKVSAGNTLTIFAEIGENTGELIATSDSGTAIGGDYSYSDNDGGTIIINGGNIKAYENDYLDNAAIGGAMYGSGSTFTLNDGSVHASVGGAHKNAHAIGGGNDITGQGAHSKGNINLPNVYIYWYKDTAAEGIKYVKGGPVAPVDTTRDDVKIQGFSSACKMTSFEIDGQIGQTLFDGTSISITMPRGTDVTALKPTFATSEKSSIKIQNTTQESGITENNFTNPLTYRVTAQNEFDVKDYIVTVNIEKNSASEMTTFGIDGQVGQTTFDGTNVSVTMPYGTDITTLKPTFTISEDANIKIEGTVQESGVTENDFTNPLTYRVTAQNGTNTKDYTVVVNVEKNSASEMTTFGIDGQIGQTLFDETNVLVVMPYGTDATTLKPAFTLSADANVKIENNIQESGVTANDFTNPLTYKVTAQNGINSKDYIVTVRVEKNSVCSIESFKIDSQMSSQIDNAKKIITIEMPITNQTSSFAPQIEVSPGATVSPENGVEKDFTNDVMYTVTAQDGIASEVYTVKVVQKFQWWIDVDGYQVGLTAPAGVFAPGSKFFAREIKYDRDNEEFMRITNDIDLRHKEIYDTVGLYEFTVKNSNDQNYTNLSDYATIRIETEGDFDPDNIEALRIEKTEDVPLEKIRKETINNKIYFTADLNHFSYYALMDKISAQSSDPWNIETGDKSTLWTTIISAIAIVSGGGFLLSHKNKKRKNKN